MSDFCGVTLLQYTVLTFSCGYIIGSDVIDGTQELECTCNLNNSTVCLKLKLREMLCGWDGLVQFNITINDRIELNATIATTNTIEYCIPISMLPETPENYVFDVFATNACGETSNKESFNVNCAGKQHSL